MNPGQSVKDRAALYIVKVALDRGLLKPGGTVVEGTAGNTGIGIAVVGNALGLKSVIVIPDTQSQEKKDALRLLGAQLIEVPAVPYRDPNNYVKVSERLAKQLAKDDPKARSGPTSSTMSPTGRRITKTTGPEIWEQTEGLIDGFTCSVGTGGTLAAASASRSRRAIRTCSSPPPIRWARRSIPGSRPAS